jgi:hypothetical protein
LQVGLKPGQNMCGEQRFCPSAIERKDLEPLS